MYLRPGPEPLTLSLPRPQPVHTLSPTCSYLVQGGPFAEDFVRGIGLQVSRLEVVPIVCVSLSRAMWTGRGVSGDADSVRRGHCVMRDGQSAGSVCGGVENAVLRAVAFCTLTSSLTPCFLGLILTQHLDDVVLDLDLILTQHLDDVVLGVLNQWEG